MYIYVVLDTTPRNGCKEQIPWRHAKYCSSCSSCGASQSLLASQGAMTWRFRRRVKMFCSGAMSSDNVDIFLLEAEEIKTYVLYIVFFS